MDACYDTIYAHLDKADDALIGVKSTARRLGRGDARLALVFLWACPGAAGDGRDDGRARLALLRHPAAVAAHFAWQIMTLDIDDPDNCLARFRSNREAGVAGLDRTPSRQSRLSMASSDWYDPRNLPALPGVPGLVSLQRNVEDLVNLTLDRTVRLAVTGLRQSGKTVFITALVHHLLNGQELPFFTPVKQKRLMGARLLPPYVGDPPAFPFEESRKALAADAPSWPSATRGLSSLRLELRVANTGFLARQFADYRSQQVEIIDYPGEWLLDLPMMEQSFEDWSEATIALARSPARRELASDWLSAVEEKSTHSGADRAATLAELYRRYLKSAQVAGFSFLQPGRMTMPARWKVLST